MSLESCLLDLEKNGHLVRVKEEVDPNLEIAEVHRRAYEQKAPALLFENVKGTPFRCVSNLFGTKERSHYIFRDTLSVVKEIVKLKASMQDGPQGIAKSLLKNPIHSLNIFSHAIKSFPKRVSQNNSPVLAYKTTIDQLPQIKCWEKDGGAFITCPQVYSEDVNYFNIKNSNVGVYRAQLSGNQYKINEEIGLHYQINRGIGIHHQKALEKNTKLPVSIFVGGHPAHFFSAIMPLPEGISELLFAGMLSGKSFRYFKDNQHLISSDADFCITGTIDRETKLEGPFGDHLGYYSLEHPFPVLKVQSVFHKKDAIWPFTVVGRPPQEDTAFGDLIHEITGPMVPISLPGVKALHAVDASGVHPLLFAIGSERYVPYEARKPREILAQANAVLGFNQCSLAKYLFITADGDNPNLDIRNIKDFLNHVLSRVDWTRDLHFQTKTTMDTLDYSGGALNEGSKLVIAAAGEVKRQLSVNLPSLSELPDKFKSPKICIPGVMAVQATEFKDYETAKDEVNSLIEVLKKSNLESVPLIILSDDSEFTSKNLNNFLWITFTRSNPSHDCYGVEEEVSFKHWGCRGPLIIDARLKPHYAPPLTVDKGVKDRVDDLCISGKSLYKVID